MINEIKKDAQERMKKSVESLMHNFGRIRTGQAHPSILEGVMVPYYGSDTPIKQVANITVKDARTLQVVAFERNMLGAVDKAIGSAGLNLNPTNLGELLLISMPALTEETRKGFTKQARDVAEDARVAVRNIRRDANSQLKDLVKELLCIEISKQQQTSDWGAPELSDAQREYAASDVRYLHALKEKLDERLVREKRVELAHSCFDFLPHRALLDLAGWPEQDIFAHDG